MNRYVLFTKLTTVILLTLLWSVSLHAQKKYMLCVGINNYTDSTADSITTISGRVIPNLHGCVNDVNNISDVFATYYGFPQQNIKKLLDRDATRNGIITSLKQYAALCKTGDYMVFYYSGHGSYWKDEETQRNLQKQYTNTIVPADANVDTADIDNLTLNDLFLPFVTNGVHLTVIMDACHSGTNTRGTTLLELAGLKEVEPVPEEFRSTERQQKQTVVLSTKGAVILAACEDDEPSEETKIGNEHCGVFTHSLCNVIRGGNNAASLQEIFNLTLAQMKFCSKPQVPHLEAGNDRKNMNLPGTDKAEKRKLDFPLVNRDGSTYEIQGGFLDGLSAGDLLVNEISKDTVKVDSVEGPQRSVIIPVNVSGQLKNNSLLAVYSVLQLAQLPEPPVKVYVGEGLSRRDLDKAWQQAADMQKVSSLHWISPSDGIIPQAIIYYNTSSGNWQMNKNGNDKPVILKNAAADTALTQLKKGTPVFLELPCPDALASSLTTSIQTNTNKNIGLQTLPDNANYMLTGTLHNGQPEFGWMNMNWKTAQQADIPFRTDFFGVENTNKESRLPTDSLYDRLSKLAKIAGWLTLQSPVTESAISFPFTVKIKNRKDQLIADDSKNGQVITGDTLKINFEKDDTQAIANDSNRMFIYVFSIDPKGNMQLIFPGERTSIFDYPYPGYTPWLATIRNTTPGIYHFFLLACKERILNTDVFNQQGVITRSAGYYDNPLEALINDAGTNGRGSMFTPANWLLKKVDIVTTDKADTVNKN